MEQAYYIGVDIGGTHICAAGVNNGRIAPGTLFRQPVQARGAANSILSGWADVIQQAIQALPAGQPAGIGFAMPGPFDYEEGRSFMKGQDKFDALYGLNIREALQQRLHLPDDIPLVFENDAICFALGESAYGQARRHERLLLLTLGTGLGAAFVHRHTPLTSGKGVPPGGTLYNVPFKDGIAEDYLSTRWFVKAYRELTGQTVEGAKTLHTAALQGNAIAAELFREFGRNLAQVLSPWIRSFAAEALVLGGNISKAAQLFLPDMKAYLKEAGTPVPVVISGMEEAAALLGAAMVAQLRVNHKSAL